MQRDFDFYIVPTPIGNLDDITIRAIDILKNVDLIACEDTRTTQNLLNRYDIKTKTVSYHKYNEKSKAQKILDFIQSGKKVALVSDAGTPMICDPGNVLIKELRNNDVSITSLAGACAIPTFLSQVPRDNEIFTFIGFFPKTAQLAEEILINFSKSNIVFYESPNRIKKTLEFIRSVRGDVQVALARELTKLYEETFIGNIDNVIDYINDGIKGEIIAMVYQGDVDIEISSKIKILKQKGFKSKEIATILSSVYGVNKNEVYKLTM